MCSIQGRYSDIKLGSVVLDYFFFFFKEEAGKDKSKCYQSVATVINVIECPVFRRCLQNDSS